MPAITSPSGAPHPPPAGGAQIISPGFFRDDDAFIVALKAGRADAQAELYRRYMRRVAAVIHRVLGRDSDQSDLVQEVFVNALKSASSFRGDSQTLEPWLVRIAVYTARGHIRKRALRRRFFLEVDEPPPVATSDVSPERLQALQRTYAIFEKLPANERIPLSLQLIDEMTLPEIADTCGVSTSTVKRRLSRAKERFESLAARDPILRGWVAGGAT